MINEAYKNDCCYKNDLTSSRLQPDQGRSMGILCARFVEPKLLKSSANFGAKEICVSHTKKNWFCPICFKNRIEGGFGSLHRYEI